MLAPYSTRSSWAIRMLIVVVVVVVVCSLHFQLAEQLQHEDGATTTTAAAAAVVKATQPPKLKEVLEHLFKGDDENDDDNDDHGEAGLEDIESLEKSIPRLLIEYFNRVPVDRRFHNRSRRILESNGRPIGQFRGNTRSRSRGNRTHLLVPLIELILDKSRSGQELLELEGDGLHSCSDCPASRRLDINSMLRRLFSANNCCRCLVPRHCKRPRAGQCPPRGSTCPPCKHMQQQTTTTTTTTTTASPDTTDSELRILRRRDVDQPATSGANEAQAQHSDGLRLFKTNLRLLVKDPTLRQELVGAFDSLPARVDGHHWPRAIELLAYLGDQVDEPEWNLHSNTTSQDNSNNYAFLEHYLEQRQTVQHEVRFTRLSSKRNTKALVGHLLERYRRSLLGAKGCKRCQLNKLSGHLNVSSPSSSSSSSTSKLNEKNLLSKGLASSIRGCSFVQCPACSLVCPVDPQCPLDDDDDDDESCPTTCAEPQDGAGSTAKPANGSEDELGSSRVSFDMSAWHPIVVDLATSFGLAPTNHGSGGGGGGGKGGKGGKGGPKANKKAARRPPRPAGKGNSGTSWQMGGGVSDALDGNPGAGLTTGTGGGGGGGGDALDGHPGAGGTTSGGGASGGGGDALDGNPGGGGTSGTSGGGAGAGGGSDAGDALDGNPGGGGGTSHSSSACGRAPLNKLTPGGAAAAGGAAYINNGKRQVYGEWPQYVRLSLQSRPGWFSTCGGVLVGADRVLTAAHCVLDHKTGRVTPASGIQVFAGEHHIHTRDKHERVLGVSRVCPASQYSVSQTDNTVYDYAVLTLASPIPSAHDYIQPACLPTSPPTYSKCFLVGAGAYRMVGAGHDKTPINPDYVQTMEVVKSSCVSWRVPKGDISRACFTKKGGPGDSCAGDSGGPVLCLENNKWTVVGLVSYGTLDCNGGGYGNFIGVYANVPAMLPTIRQTCGL